MKSYNGNRDATGKPRVIVVEGSESRLLTPRLLLDASQTPSPEFNWGERTLPAFCLAVALCLDVIHDAERNVLGSDLPFAFLDRVVSQLPFWSWELAELPLLGIMRGMITETNLLLETELAARRTPGNPIREPGEGR